MKLWRHAVIAYLRLAFKAGLLKSRLTTIELRRLLANKYEVGWRVFLQSRILKRHFLGYAARYIRRPPIAQHRFREIDGLWVKFLTKDTARKTTMLDEIPKEDFVRILADHILDKYCHSIRYYGLLAPRSPNRVFTSLYQFIGQIRRPRPHPLSWAELIKKSFNRNPLVDSCGRLMRYIGQYFTGAA